MSKPSIFKWILLLFIVVLLILGIYRYAVRDLTGGSFQVGKAYLDINNPDVIIKSNDLTSLPKDILKVDILKNLLTEDFVFYYNNTSAQRSLEGTLHRLAYEHDLKIQDHLIKNILAKPSEIYAWNDRTSKPKYWVIVSENNLFSKLMEVFARIALSDSQLIEAASIKVDGKAIPLYAIKYQGHIGLFASHKNRMIFISDVNIVFEQEDEQDNISEDGIYLTNEQLKSKDVTIIKAKKIKGKIIDERIEKIIALLSNNPKKNSQLFDKLQLAKQDNKHVLYFSPALLSLSYHRLIPDFKGISFIFKNNHWEQKIAVTSNVIAKKMEHKLFSITPYDVAMCSLAPLNWVELSKLSKKMSSIKNISPNFKYYNHPVLVCWFKNSPLSAPVILTHIDNTVSKQQQKEILQLFDYMIGANEHTRGKRFEIIETQIDPSIKKISRIVSARYGSHKVSKLSQKEQKQLSSANYFPVSIVFAGEYIMFSPNDDLLNKFISVYQKKYPSLADSLENPKQTISLFNTKELAVLLKEQSYSIIKDSPDLISVFKEKAQPKLDYLSKQKNKVMLVDLTAVSGNDSNFIWVPVIWQNARDQ